MRVLIVDRWFWPDQRPHAVVFLEIAARWVADGHDVTVLTARDRAPDGNRLPRNAVVRGIRVIRCARLPERRTNLLARALNMGVLMLRTLLHVCRSPRYDAMVCSTMPPVFLAASVRLAASLRGSSFIYQLMDVHPEGGIAVEVLRPGLLTRFMRWVDTRTCRRATRVVPLSRDMQETLRRRGLSCENVRVLNNFDLRGDCTATTEKGPVPRLQGEFRVLFAGNMGRFQGLQSVMDAAGALEGSPDIQFHFVGGGMLRDELAARAGDLVDRTVHFHGLVPIETARKWMSDSDLGIVCIRPGVYRTAFPSKTMTYLGVGLPMLVVVEEESELARMVSAERIGWRAEQGNSEAIAGAITTAYSSRSALPAMRERALALFAREFDREVVLDRWSDLLQEVAAEQRAS